MMGRGSSSGLGVAMAIDWATIPGQFLNQMAAVSSITPSPTLTQAEYLALPYSTTAQASVASGLNSGSKVASVLGAISGFINTTFPAVYTAITGKPISTTATTQAGAVSAATSPQAQAVTDQAAQIRELLLVAGVAVLGVALALWVFRKQRSK